MYKEQSPTRTSTKDPEKYPVDVTKGSDLGERDFCGMWWEQKPGLLWVEKSIEVRRWR